MSSINPHDWCVPWPPVAAIQCHAILVFFQIVLTLEWHKTNCEMKKSATEPLVLVSSLYPFGQPFSQFHKRRVGKRIVHRPRGHSKDFVPPYEETMQEGSPWTISKQPQLLLLIHSASWKAAHLWSHTWKFYVGTEELPSCSPGITWSCCQSCLHEKAWVYTMVGHWQNDESQV